MFCLVWFSTNIIEINEAKAGDIVRRINGFYSKTGLPCMIKQNIIAEIHGFAYVENSFKIPVQTKRLDTDPT